jgi:pyruvate dehydrogenase E1 component alpha subunit
MFQIIETEIRKSVDNAVKATKTDKELPLNELTCDIYTTCLEKNIRNISPFNPLPHMRLGPAINA